MANTHNGIWEACLTGRYQEPAIEQSKVAVEMPLSGFQTFIRGNTVRLVGYITRGDPGSFDRTHTVTLHIAKNGYERSLAMAVKAWRDHHGRPPSLN